jgi:hypothetical protein
MAKANEFHLIKAPDGFYFGRILKSGMLASDSRRITDEEVMAMTEDLLTRNRAETGRSVMSVFSHGKPVFVAKLNPDITECDVLPEPERRQLSPMEMRMREMMMRQMRQRTPGARKN